MTDGIAPQKKFDNRSEPQLNGPSAIPLFHPWQQVTVGSGLMLHAPLTARVNAATLQREFAALDAAMKDEGRQFRAVGRRPRRST